MAHQTPPVERRAFLAQLTPPTENPVDLQDILQQTDLLADIDDLQREIEHAIKHAAEPWDDDYGWGEYDDEEDSLGPYENFVAPIEALFEKIEAVFDYGDFPLVRAAYAKLYPLLMLEDDYGRGIHVEDLTGLDKAETRARYLRAVYEAEPQQTRPDALFKALDETRSWLSSSRPLLNDLIQISPRLLPDQDAFLHAWIAFLRPQDGKDADAWLREAVRLLHGAAGLAELARGEGLQRPRAYLDWLTMLAEANKQPEVFTAAQEALQNLPSKLPIRAAIADHLCAAAAYLEDEPIFRHGRWEAFTAKPELARLLDVWDCTPASERPFKMSAAAHYLQAYLEQPGPKSIGIWSSRDDELETPAQVNHAILTHAWLLAGEWEAAHKLAAQQNVLGWSGSGNPQGLVLAYFLGSMSGRRMDKLPPNLAQLWQDRLQASLGFGYWTLGDNHQGSLSTRIEQIYAKESAPLTLSAFDIVSRRADKNYDLVRGDNQSACRWHCREQAAEKLLEGSHVNCGGSRNAAVTRGDRGSHPFAGNHTRSLPPAQSLSK